MAVFNGISWVPPHFEGHQRHGRASSQSPRELCSLAQLRTEQVMWLSFLICREGTQILSRVTGGYRETWHGQHLIQLSPAHSGVAKAVVEGPLQVRECGWEPPQLTLTLTLASPALALQLRDRRPRHAYPAKVGERMTLKPTGVVRSDNPWAARWHY